MMKQRIRITGLLVALVALAACSPNAATDTGGAEANLDTVTVYKTEACGCCLKWVDHLKANAFAVEVVNVDSTAPTREKYGVPPNLMSCHTGIVDDYWVEGHVPADLVKRLITEKPDNILGISAPGMPMGSPGMEGPRPVTFDVIAYHTDGTTSVYATREGKETVE